MSDILMPHGNLKIGNLIRACSISLPPVHIPVLWQRVFHQMGVC
jgi:hypothetical protein